MRKNKTTQNKIKNAPHVHTHTATWVDGEGSLGLSGNVTFGDDGEEVDNKEGSYLIRVYKDEETASLRFEGYFTRTASNNYDFFNVKITVAYDYSADGHGSYSRIYLTRCFEERTCGLCGVWDGDTTNDFTFVDDDGSRQNEDGSEFSTVGVSDIFSISQDQWDQVQEFGFEWTDQDLIDAINQPGDCTTYTESNPPPVDCLERAREVCITMGCICVNYPDEYPNFVWETWLQNCAFDSCAASGDRIDELYPTSDEDAINSGYFDGAAAVTLYI